MRKYLSLFLFIGLTWGQDGFDELLIEKAEKNIKFKTGQKLIINYIIKVWFIIGYQTQRV